MNKALGSVSNKFAFAGVSLAVISVVILALALYQANAIRFSEQVSSEKLYETIEGNQAVEDYLDSEKDFEAHFITIANLVKEDQQTDTRNTILFMLPPIIVITGLLGYFASRYLIKPVRISFESQERFLQDAAHELRNPLAAMSTTLENADSSGKASKELVRTMKRQTKRLIRINEDLLFLERLNATDSIQEIDISELLQDILEDMKPVMVKKKINLATNIQPNITYKIDQKDFIKLARNIIENAIKYSKSGKHLKIELMKNKRISLTVADQGIGIPESDLKSVGERFFRAKNVSNVDGTGLGLSIVNKVLNTYGGEISISSQVNKGTKVQINL